MTHTHEYAPFTILVDERPEIHEAMDIAVVIRGPFGSYYLAVDVAGNYHLHHDPAPGTNEVRMTTLAHGDIYGGPIE